MSQKAFKRLIEILEPRSTGQTDQEPHATRKPDTCLIRTAKNKGGIIYWGRINPIDCYHRKARIGWYSFYPPTHTTQPILFRFRLFACFRVLVCLFVRVCVCVCTQCIGIGVDITQNKQKQVLKKTI